MAKSPREIHNSDILKSRCRSFLNPNENQCHGDWKKINDFVYFGTFNIVVPEDGENYSVHCELERKINGIKRNYKLSFADIEESLDNKSYKPLRTLGRRVFN